MFVNLIVFFFTYFNFHFAHDELGDIQSSYRIQDLTELLIFFRDQKLQWGLTVLFGEVVNFV
jgi:hypothetical protein